MEEFSPPLTASIDPITQLKMERCSQNNSQLSIIHGPVMCQPSSAAFPNSSSTESYHYYPPQYQLPTPQLPCTYSLAQQLAGQYSSSLTADPFLGTADMQRPSFPEPNGVAKEQERRLLDAYRTKVARSKRRLARQKSLARYQSSGPNSFQHEARGLAWMNVAKNDISIDLYKFSTPDNKRLRLLLKKELKNSDVGSLGRIVLPKKEAEEHLPTLSGKEGIPVVMRDFHSNQKWNFKFKYWSNNMSRMYVLDNAGDFVKQNGLKIGDSLTLYEDESKNLYFSVSRVERPAAEPSSKRQPINQNYQSVQAPHVQQARDEDAEEPSAQIIEQFCDQEQPQDSNNLTTASTDVTNEEEASVQGKMRMGEDYHIDDCYNGLGILPDVNSYHFLL